LSKESKEGLKALQIVDFAVNIEDAHFDLIKSCAFMKHSKPDVIVDSAIMVLSLLSYMHSKQPYANIFNWVERVFTYYINDIINSDSILIKARYALFLGYLIDVLYRDNVEAFTNTLFFLFKSVDL
jgi:hypothetical protein